MMATCERCGSSIKNVFTYQGKNYGCECVLIVSGLKSYEVKNIAFGNIDEYLAKKAEYVSKMEAKQQAHEAKQAELKAIHEVKNEWLIDLLTQQDYVDVWSNKKGCYIPIHMPKFYSSLAEQLSVKSLNDLSDKQFNCIWDLLNKFPLKSLKSFTKELRIDLKEAIKEHNLETIPSKLKKDDLIGIILSKF